MDIPGGYKCGCKEGYYGDGIKSCKLANECKQGLHDCHKTLATCINTRKSFDCRCKDGFEGDGRSCKDINECDSGKHNCPKVDGVLCVNTNGSFNCVCKTGFTGNGKHCANINECTTGTHKCAKYAVCTDNIGSYSCKCKEGFDGDPWKECSGNLCLALFEVSFIDHIIAQVILTVLLVLGYDLLEDRCTIDAIITKFFPLCFKMANFFDLR